jgi:hypothetical protein
MQVAWMRFISPVLPRDRRIPIFSIKGKSVLTVTKERAFINALFLGLDGPQVQIDSMLG